VVRSGSFKDKVEAEWIFARLVFDRLIPLPRGQGRSVDIANIKGSPTPPARIPTASRPWAKAVQVAAIKAPLTARDMNPVANSPA